MSRNKRIARIIAIISVIVFLLTVYLLYFKQTGITLEAKSHIDDLLIFNKAHDQDNDLAYRDALPSDSVSISTYDDDKFVPNISQQSKRVSLLPFISSADEDINVRAFRDGAYSLLKTSETATSRITYDTSAEKVKLLYPETDFSVNGQTPYQGSSVLESYTAKQNSIVEINDSLPFNLSGYDNNKFLSLNRYTQSVVRIYDQVSGNALDKDAASFEGTTWRQKAVDCSDKLTGIADIYVKQSNDTTDGEDSIEIGSNNHFACVDHKFTVHSLDPNANFYQLSFDYKSPKGNKAKYYYAFLDKNGNKLATSNSGTTISSSTNWKTYNLIISASKLKKFYHDIEYLEVYFYAPSDGNEEIVNLYDNLALTSYKLTDEHRLKGSAILDGLFKKTSINMRKGTNKIQFHADETNMLGGDNYSFESGLWQSSANDCSNQMPGQPDFNLKLESNASDGHNAATIASKNHHACISQWFPVSLSENRTYKLRFDYRNNKNGGGKYYIQLKNDRGQQQTITSNIKEEPENYNWHTIDVYIDPNISDITAVGVWLYSVSDGTKEVENSYDYLRLTEQSSKDISTYYFQNEQNIASEKQPDVTYKLLNNYKLEAHIQSPNQAQLLVLTQPYDENWKVFGLHHKKTFFESLNPFFYGEKLNQVPHYKVSGTTNGWWISSPCENGADCLSHGRTESIDIYFVNTKLSKLLFVQLASFTVAVLTISYLAYRRATKLLLLLTAFFKSRRRHTA